MVGVAPQLFEMIRGSVTRAAVGDDFDGNEFTTNYWVGFKPFAATK